MGRGYPGLHPGAFSAVPTGLDQVFESYPGLTSWAIFSRPYGTEFAHVVFAPTHLSFISNGVEPQVAPVGMTSWGWRVQCAVASGV
jgi:hypothetical protein